MCKVKDKKNSEKLAYLWVNVCKFLPCPKKNYVTSVSFILNPLSANCTKWSNTLKQFVDNLPTNCLSVFGHFVGLALKGLN